MAFGKVVLLAAAFALFDITSSNPLPPNPSELESDLEDADYINEVMSSLNPDQRRIFASNYLYPYMLQRAMEEAEKGEGPAPDDEQPLGNEVGYAPPPPQMSSPVNAHSVDKRRRRYGFWITAINKMDNGHLKGFLGKHKNIYNVYKRNGRGVALPRMH